MPVTASTKYSHANRRIRVERPRSHRSGRRPLRLVGVIAVPSWLWATPQPDYVHHPWYWWLAAQWWTYVLVIVLVWAAVRWFNSHYVRRSR